MRPTVSPRAWIWIAAIGLASCGRSANRERTTLSPERSGSATGSAVPASTPAIGQGAAEGSGGQALGGEPRGGGATDTATTGSAAPAGMPSGGGGGGGGANTNPLAGTSNPFSDRMNQNDSLAGECRNDGDCRCGIDRATSACAVGPAQRIDESRQCPDFCSGIDGHLRVTCAQGRCTQVRN